MTQTYRGDSPGAWHHVTSRGIARRPVFENREDIRFFLSRVARCVRAGLIEVHAYAVMTTHYHLLLRSLAGQLSNGMQSILNGYVRWFNRSRQRDGPLFRGRFCSKPIESLEHWLAVVRYIDQNPVLAGICAAGESYPHGSAYHFARPRGPIWLSRVEIEAEARRALGKDRYETSDYRKVYGQPLEEAWTLALERYTLGGRRQLLLQDLVRGSSAAVRDWMDRKARLADGTPPGRTPVDSARLQQFLRDLQWRDPDKLVRAGARNGAGWLQLEAGLLRYASGLRLREVAERMGSSPSTSHHRIRGHDRLMREDSRYHRVAEWILDHLGQPAPLGDSSSGEKLEKESGLSTRAP